MHKMNSLNLNEDLCLVFPLFKIVLQLPACAVFFLASIFLSFIF